MIRIHQDKARIKDYPHLSFSFYSRENWNHREYFLAEDTETGNVLGMLCYVPNYDSIYAEPGTQVGPLFSFIGITPEARGQGIATKLVDAFFTSFGKNTLFHITGLEPDFTDIMIPLLQKQVHAGYQLYHRGLPWSQDNCIS